MDPIFVPTIEGDRAAWCRLRRVLFDYSAASTGCELRSASPAWPCSRRRPPLESPTRGSRVADLHADDVEALKEHAPFSVHCRIDFGEIVDARRWTP